MEILKFVLLLACVVSIFGQRKPGDCPPSLDVEACYVSCTADAHCLGSDKCCRTSCGGTTCITPITMRAPEKLAEKPGYCPRNPSGPWVCSSRCAFDGDCRGRRKCCRNRCGAMACTLPNYC